MTDYINTHVEIEKHKKELMKRMAERNGITIKQFVNDAIDLALGIQNADSIQLLNDKEKLEKELQLLDETHAIAIEKYNTERQTLLSKIKIIESQIDDAEIVIAEETMTADIRRVARAIRKHDTVENINKMKQALRKTYNLTDEELNEMVYKEFDNL